MSKRIAFVFPGQGSQYVGMGLSIIEANSACRQVLTDSSEILGFDVEEVLRTATEEQLAETGLTQPLLYILNYLSAHCLKEHKVVPHYVGGHSLGEFSALVAAGMLDFQDGLLLVKKRSELMAEAADKHPGKMLALLGLSDEVILKVLETITVPGVLAIANYNCPGQVVLSGDIESVDFAELIFREKGAKRVISLKVSGAFHSPLMSEAQQLFAKEIDDYTFRSPSIPIVSNSTGKLSNDKDEILKALKLQIANPVLWTRSTETLIDIGVNIFIEAGPARVLCGLIRRTYKDIEVYSVEDEASLEHTVKSLRAQGL